MKRFVAALFAVVSLFAMSAADSIGGGESGVRTHGPQTNWVDHWTTNTIGVQMEVNRFITEYHTNWITHFRTNFVDLFSTNLVTKMVTNYHTNWITQFKTNFVDRFSTNLVTKVVTNTFVLDEVQTNFVQAYQTNLQTLSLTNWTTVLAFKTNWVTKPLTNLVQIEMARETTTPSALAVKPPALTEPLALQASRSARPTTNNQVEVQLTVSWTHEPAMPVRVQQWRIEREDGSILCFGQDPEFKRALPVGTYKVLVRAQRDIRSPLLAALGTLTVTSREVSLEQRPARSNSSS